MQKNQLILLFSLLSISALGFANVLNLTSEQLLEAQEKGTTIIDIRTPEEWVETGTIKGAQKIMFFDQQRKPLVAEFMEAFEKIVMNKDQPFILVCRSGSRTKAVSHFLDVKLGYTKAAHLAKGINQWIAERREVEKNTSHH